MPTLKTQRHNPETSNRLARLSNLLTRNEGPDGDPEMSAAEWREYDRLTDHLIRNRDLERIRD